MADNNNSMGDRFMQRRRQVAAASQSASTPLTSLSSAARDDSNNSSNSGNSGNRKKSFLEIQQEQEQQLQRDRQRQHQSYQQQQPPRSSSQAGSSGGGGGSYSNYDSQSSSRYNQNQQQQSYNRSSSTSQRSLYNPNNNNRRGGNDRDNRRSSHHQQRISTLPLEQGVIHTLLDKFGFILCADRNIELFFHYSEFKSGHSDDLQIGDEVEFRVTEDPKLAALDVRELSKGTIWWEREEVEGKVWEGVVELSCGREDGDRGDRGGGRRSSGVGKKGGGSSDGIIRLKADSSGQDDVGDEQQQQVDVYYTPSDYKPTRKQSGGQQHSRLERKDVIQFKLFTKRRTGKKYARSITLVQSERERQRLEREAKLLENASLERGKVVSTKGDFGFLRSVSRVEEVYYHLSHVESADGDDDNRMASLMVGQEVEFYVVNEQGGGGGGGRGSKKGSGGGKSLSARKIKLLPEGTVKFEHELAQGVTGYVLECPVEAPSADSFFGGPSKKSGGGGSSNTTAAVVMGKIRLDTPIIDTEGNEVTEVVLHPDMYPCGTFTLSRTSGEVGIWIRPGDTLLFDVIQIIADGTFRAMPTKHSQCLSLRSEEATTDDISSNKALIRLVKPSLCGRTEGVIRSIRDNFGFIHSAERNVDVYFPLFEVMPNEIHSDLIHNNPDVYNGSDPVQNKSGRIHVEVGMEVSFDLSLQILTNAGGGGRGGGGGRSRQNNFGAAQEKEGLRGRRVQILPKGSVQEKFLIASQVKATVTKVDPKQPFIGMMELEEPLTIQSANLRHPLVKKLLDAISAGNYGDEITFHDVLGEIDSQLVVSMVKSRDDLEWLYVPVSGDNAEDPHNRKLRIVRKVRSNDAVESPEKAENEVAVAVEIEGTKGESEGGSANLEASEADAAVDAAKLASTEKSPQKPNGRRREKIVKTIRYSKHSFPDMSDGPVGVGDVVTCDIVLSRVDGSIIVENIAVVERKERPAVISDGEDGKSSIRKDLKGFVTEVVPSRQFGFITAVDEEGSKTGDHVFFHFKSVGADDDAKKATRSDAIRKGDEVKFDAGPGKNGKLTATNISMLPRGTLKTTAKVDKATTCTGYILMEPSHTSLANTPSHIAYKSNGPNNEGGGGRWDNVKEARFGDKKSGSTVKEEGTILLLSDPSHVFSPKPSSTKIGAATQPTDAENEGQSAAPTDETKQDEGNQSKSEDEAATTACVRIRYKTSSIAYRTAAGGVNMGAPKRGDLVIFGKTRGANLVKDIRVEKAGAATNVAGTLEDINIDADTAAFVTSSNQERYEIKLSEVISCDKSLLQDKEKVDGILHEGHIYGVCRTKDIHLASSFNRDRSGSSGGLKERPRLNLTVKKELRGMGGQIMAQSRMAKGPDGTNGFVKGWTTRLSVFVKEFVPSIESIEASGFEANDVETQVEEPDAEVTTEVGAES